MATEKKWAHASAPTRITARVLFTSLIGASVFAVPQSPQALQISSPANGSTVNPGQTLSVTVTSPAGTVFQMISLIGPDPIGFNTLATSAPAQFSIAIPADADCRFYTLTADGLTQSGQHATSAPIQIDLERADVPMQISASDSGLVLESLGEQVHLVVFASFSDGSTINVTRSSLVSYGSSNTSVAAVDASGTVTGAAPGSASITATYAISGQSRQVSIPVNVSPPKLAVSPASLTFGSQSVGTSSPAQQLTLSNVSPDNLSVLALTASGDFSETDNCIASSPLGASSTCTANVTFSPTAAGARAGTLNIANSANIIPISIPLSGTGTTAPAITGLSPSSGAVGSSVTITGVNFGASQGTSTVTFNGTATGPTSWSATSIVTPVPSGATTGNVVVTVSGVASNGVSFTVVVNRPVAYVQGNSATLWNTTNTVMTLPYTGAQTIAAASPNANVVKVTFATAPGNPEIKAAEYSGLDTVNPLDVSVANQGYIADRGYTCIDPNTCPGDLSTSGPVTTTNANDLLVGANTVDYVVGEFTIGPGAGFTSRITTANGDILEDKLVSATGSYAATAPLFQDGEFIMQMVALRAATH